MDITKPEKILVPLDGSELADRVVPFAAGLVRAGDEMILLRAVTQAETARREGPPEDMHEAERHLAATAERLTAAGHRATTHVYVGDPATAILEAVESLQPTLVAMSSHGRSGVGRWLYGSVAELVLRKVDLPTLIVPAGCTRVWAAGRPLRILVPVVSSEPGNAGLELATRRFAGDREAIILLLQVIEPPARLVFPGDALAYMGRSPEEQAAEASAHLDELRKELRGKGFQAETQIVGGYAAASICDTAEVQEADIIVMGTHARGELARLVLGSTAAEVLHHAKVPVLLARVAG